jgi:hypothetical protein
MATMPITIDATIDGPFENVKAFFSLSKATEHLLRHNTVTALQNIFVSLNSSVEYAVHSDSKDEFHKRRIEAFRSYAKLIRAISLIAETEIEDDKLVLLGWDSLSHLQDEFVSLGIVRFGSEAAEQVSFCIFTLKRTIKLLPRIAHAPVAAQNRQRDRELSARFAEHMLTTHFHLFCMRSIIKHSASIHPAIVDAVLEGLQSSSIAYATLREGLELRANPALSLDDNIVLDEEDQALLDESEHSGSALP